MPCEVWKWRPEGEISLSKHTRRRTGFRLGFSLQANHVRHAETAILVFLSQNGNSTKQLRNELLQREKGTRISINPLSNMTTTQFVFTTDDSKVPVKRAYYSYCNKYKRNKGSVLSSKQLPLKIVPILSSFHTIASCIWNFSKIGYVFRTDKMPRAGIFQTFYVVLWIFLFTFEL